MSRRFGMRAGHYCVAFASGPRAARGKIAEVSHFGRQQELAGGNYECCAESKYCKRFCFAGGGEVSSSESTQMICQQFEQLAPQIAHNELRNAKLLRDATNHAESCANCGAILAEEREIAASVGALAAHDKAIDSAGHLEFTLRTAFAREHARNEGVGDLKGAPMKSWSSNVFLGGAFGWKAFSLAGAAIIFAILLVPGIVGHKSEPNRAGVTPAHVASPAVVQAKISPPMETVTPLRRIIHSHCTSRRRIWPSRKKLLRDFWRCLMRTICRPSNMAPS